MLSPTAFLTAAIQCAASIHPSTAYDVAKVESGVNPFAIAEIVPKGERGKSAGVISWQPTSREAALSIIRKVTAKGRRYSVGLMQITSSNFHQYGVTAERLLDPCVNLSVFERILTDCYRWGGSLKRALSCYYSGSFDYGQPPEAAFNHTSYIQRIGYAVPSTRKDIKRSTEAIHYPGALLRGEILVTAPPALPLLHYPNTIIRGDLNIAVNNEDK